MPSLAFLIFPARNNNFIAFKREKVAISFLFSYLHFLKNRYLYLKKQLPIIKKTLSALKKQLPIIKKLLSAFKKTIAYY